MYVFKAQKFVMKKRNQFKTDNIYYSNEENNPDQNTEVNLNGVNLGEADLTGVNSSFTEGFKNFENKEITIDENLTDTMLSKSGIIPHELSFKLFKIAIFLFALGITFTVMLFKLKPFNWRFALILIGTFLLLCFFGIRTASVILGRKYDTFSGTCIAVKKPMSAFLGLTGKRIYIRDDNDENTIYSLEVSKKDPIYESGCHVVFYTTPRTQMLERHKVISVIQPLLIECDKISEGEVDVK